MSTKHHGGGDEENKGKFFKHISTDYDNQTFDTGRALVVIVVISMVLMQAWDVVIHKAAFHPQEFGAGVGALLVGLGAYLFGDSKRPEPPPVYSPFNPYAPPIYSPYPPQPPQPVPCPVPFNPFLSPNGQPNAPVVGGVQPISTQIVQPSLPGMRWAPTNVQQPAQGSNG